MLNYRDFITRGMLHSEPDTLFVFGDNGDRKGLGGQAREMRGEPNAVGIITKRHPNMHPTAFLSDFDYASWSRLVAADFKRLREHPGPIIWPAAGIGTGLAQLQEQAPMIWRTLEAFRQELEYRETRR